MTENYKPYGTLEECLAGLHAHVPANEIPCEHCPYNGYEVDGVGLFGVTELGDCTVPLMMDAEYYLMTMKGEQK